MTTTHTNDHGAEFTIRAWASIAADGWLTTITGEGMEPTTVRRPEPSARLAIAAAKRYIDRTWN